MPAAGPSHCSRTRLLAVVALATMPVAGCGLDLDLGDTPLGVTSDERGYVPGDPVTGVVEHPEGEISVTLAPDDLPLPEPTQHTRGGESCRYDDDEATYSCPTDGLPLGVYRVEVTDADFASEGTKIVTVGVGPGPYAPDLVVRGGTGRDPDSADGPGGHADRRGTARVDLSGWEPGREVEVRLRDARTGRVVAPSPTTTAVPSSEGRATVQVGPLPVGVYALEPTDGRWVEADVQGWNRGFLVVDAAPRAGGRGR